MGSSNSQALSFYQISQACLRIGLNKPKDGFSVSYINSIMPNLYTSTSFLFMQKVFLSQQSYPAILKNSIAANFDGFDLTATLQNTNELQFDSFSFDSHFKPTDSIDCNFQASFAKSPVYSIMSNYVSNIFNGNFSLSTTNRFDNFTYTISSGFAINDIFHLGLGFSQDDQDAPFKILSAGFVNLGVLQFSTSYSKLLAKKGDWTYTFGTNLLLDPRNVANICFETNQKQLNASIGYLCHVNGSDINATISTDGQLTSLFSHQINDNIHLETGLSFIFSTLTVSPSISIQISS